MKRIANIERKTNETIISLTLDIDGTGENNIETGIGFFNHMLQLFSKHGLFDLSIKAEGDLEVDAHHTVEDIGIVLGKAIQQALGSKESIKRYGTVFIPMEDALAMVSLDLSGRPYLVFNSDFNIERIGNMETELIEEFFRAVAINAGINLHIKIIDGKNTHHMIEAIFKAFAKALDEATRIDERINGVMSTKGSL